MRSRHVESIQYEYTGGFVLSGAVYIEMVFHWPELAECWWMQYLEGHSIGASGVVFVAAGYVFFNIGDIAQSLLDPRIKT